ncbi:hypothetical protein [Klebsiella phage 05F01]|nr:hypothetical protein [Klebsiella phage 05F01]
MVTKTKFDSIATLYRLCRASMVSQLKLQGLSDLKIAHSLTLTKNTLLSFIKCTEDTSTIPFVLDAPQYMFANREVTPTTYIDIQVMGLDTYPLSNGTALLVDPVTREFCYVFLG